ncbi:MAG TPA: futalosine hydrolase [Chitinophagaceae bacterium]|nr:futalosine hydrolase [Chitinophagaceae bacterium]
MHIVITSATEGEVATVKQHVEGNTYINGYGIIVSFHTSGVGMLASSVSLTKMALEQKPDFIIQAGIAGCFNDKAALGDVFIIGNEILADTGVDEDGIWKDLFDLNLQKGNDIPFFERGLPNTNLPQYNLIQLPVINAVTINEITTSPKRRLQIEEKYAPLTESMEGAALHYICRLQNIPFIQIRAISNYIGERNKTKWKIRDAIVNLNKTLLEYLQAFAKYTIRNTEQ